MTFIQRFGDALNLNVHFHSIVLDGVYLDVGGRFLILPPPDDREVERVTRQFVRRLRKLLLARGLVPDGDSAADLFSRDEPLLAAIYAASVRSRIATGARAGRGVLRLSDLVDPEEAAFVAGPRCVSIDGVSLHANVEVPAGDRSRREKLCRYAARPPVSTQRFSRLDDGRLLYRLKRRWRDGTTHVIFEPLELIEKLAAIVPPPRVHMTRYHGVLAPRAALRSRLDRRTDQRHQTRGCRVQGHGESGSAAPQAFAANDAGQRANRPCPPEAERARSATDPADCDRARVQHEMSKPLPDSAGRRWIPWAELMRRVFALDVLQRPQCSGPMRIMAVIHDRQSVRAILESVGLPARAPPVAAARDIRAESAHDVSPQDWSGC